DASLDELGMLPTAAGAGADADTAGEGPSKAGCACDHGGPSTGWALLGLLPVLLRRRLG
ncbi:MAG: hypothetical protein ACI8PZ_005480, partial [Myxococcota bacterium]